METFNMHEAKSQLSSLVEQALAGEEVIIAKAGIPLVMLIPIHQDDRARVAGHYKGLIHLATDFNETPEDLIQGFEG